MFIEIVEYDDNGYKIGNAIINTNDICCIDNYNSDTELYELVIRLINDVRSFNINKKEYNKLKNILIQNISNINEDVG